MSSGCSRSTASPGSGRSRPPHVRPDEFSKSGYSVAVCYLDEDPVDVAPSIAAVLTDRWERGSLKPAFAAPFVSLQPFDYERHRQPG